MSTVARVLLGLAFAVFAFNYFVPFLPAQEVPAAAVPFLTAFVGSGFLTLVKSIELAAALMLLANRLVPLALALLAPILVGISAFHILLAPAGLPVPLVLVALELVLAWAYRDAFAAMLRVRTSPRPVLSSRARTAAATTAGAGATS
jgi:putative oxidoreductase